MSLQYLLKCYSRQKHHWLLSKKSECFQTGKAKCHDLPHWGCPVTDFSPEMLVMPLFPRIDTSLPSRHAQFLSHQRNCLSHHSRSQIYESVHERNSLEPHSQTQNQEKSYFLWVVGMFRSWQTDLLNPDFYGRWKLGPSFSTGNKSTILGLTPPSISLVEKIKIFSVIWKIRDHGLLALWKND